MIHYQNFAAYFFYECIRFCRAFVVQSFSLYLFFAGNNVAAFVKQCRQRNDPLANLLGTKAMVSLNLADYRSISPAMRQCVAASFRILPLKRAQSSMRVLLNPFSFASGRHTFAPANIHQDLDASTLQKGKRFLNTKESYVCVVGVYRKTHFEDKGCHKKKFD